MNKPGNKDLSRRLPRWRPAAPCLGSVMFSKVLVANRGEIAVRAFRAAVELGAQTVAVFPWEDRNSLHRLKADQSFQIGEIGHPVRAYLSVEEILAAARTAGADAVCAASALPRSCRRH